MSHLTELVQKTFVAPQLHKFRHFASEEVSLNERDCSFALLAQVNNVLRITDTVEPIKTELSRCEFAKLAWKLTDGVLSQPKAFQRQVANRLRDLLDLVSLKVKFYQRCS